MRALPDNSLDSVDWGNPINRSHWAARGLVGFWLAVPNRRGFGTLKWRDLAKNYDLTLSSAPTTTWRPSRKAPGSNGAAWLAAASSQEFHVDSSPVGTTGVPLSMHCGFRSNDVTTGYTLMSVVDKDSNDFDQYLLQCRGDVTGDPIRVLTVSNLGTSALADTTTGYSANTWTLASGTWESITNRVAYKDGGSSATETTSLATNACDRLAIGASLDSTPTRYLDGAVNVAAIYNIAHSAAQVAQWNREWREGFPGLLNRVSLRRWAPEQAAAAASRGKIIGGGVGKASGYILGA